MTIKFLHIRQCEILDDGVLIEYSQLQQGGMTIAYTANETLGIILTIAFCHPKDHFSRKIGRELAEHRLRTDAPYQILEFQHPIAGTIRSWINRYFGFELVKGPNDCWMSPMICDDFNVDDSGDRT